MRRMRKAQGNSKFSVLAFCVCFGLAGEAYFSGLRYSFTEKLDLEVTMGGMELQVVSI